MNILAIFQNRFAFQNTKIRTPCLQKTTLWRKNNKRREVSAHLQNRREYIARQTLQSPYKAPKTRYKATKRMGLGVCIPYTKKALKTPNFGK